MGRQGSPVFEDDITGLGNLLDRDALAVGEFCEPVPGGSVAPDKELFAGGDGNGFRLKNGDTLRLFFGLEKERLAFLIFDPDKTVPLAQDLEGDAPLEKAGLAVEDDRHAGLETVGLRELRGGEPGERGKDGDGGFVRGKKLFSKPGLRRALGTGEGERDLFGGNGAVALQIAPHHPMKNQAIAVMVRNYKRLAGVERPGRTHLWRHSFATHLVQNGANIAYVQRLLGHRSLETTAIYVRVSAAEVSATHHKTHPRAKVTA